MYKVLIESGATFLFEDNGKEGIDCYKGVRGFFNNTNGIIDLIKLLPISEFYVDIPSDKGGNGLTQISKEDAFRLYDLLEKYRDEEKAKRPK